MKPLEQHQYYIPRFVLRTFQEQPSASAAATTAGAGSKKKKRRGTQTQRLTTEPIRCYDLATGEYDPECRVSEPQGAMNLYKDAPGVKNIGHIEAKLAQLESDATRIMKVIRDDADNGKQSTSLGRKDVYTLHKYLFLLHIRSEKLDGDYFRDDHRTSAGVRDWAQKQKAAQNLPADMCLWLHGLQYYLDTPTRQILKDAAQQDPNTVFQRRHSAPFDPETGIKFWHAQGFDIFHSWYYLSVCRASPDGEFILGDNSFGIWEGIVPGPTPPVHRWYILSPRVAIVLRLAMTCDPVIDMATESIFNDIPFVPPTIQYISVRPLLDPHLLQRHLSSTASDRDEFIIKIHQLSDIQTFRVNELVLEIINPNGVLSFLSEDTMLLTMLLYDTPYGPFMKSNRESLRKLKDILSKRAQAKEQGSLAIEGPDEASSTQPTSPSIVPLTTTSSPADAGHTSRPVIQSVTSSGVTPISDSPAVGGGTDGKGLGAGKSGAPFDKRPLPESDTMKHLFSPAVERSAVGSSSTTPERHLHSETLVTLPRWGAPLAGTSGRHQFEAPSNSRGRVGMGVSSLPETPGDKEFIRILTEAMNEYDKAGSIAFRSLNVYKAATAEGQEFNHTIALKIRCLLDGAIKSCTESAFGPWFCGYTSTTEPLETYLSRQEYEALFSFASVSIGLDYNIILPSSESSEPPEKHLITGAVLCGFMEWYTTHHYLWFILQGIIHPMTSSWPSSYVYRPLIGKLWKNLRFTGRARASLLHILQFMWCVWKLKAYSANQLVTLSLTSMPMIYNFGRFSIFFLLVQKSDFDRVVGEFKNLPGTLRWVSAAAFCALLVGVIRNMVDIKRESQRSRLVKYGGQLSK